jgi:hypothetical protein
MIKLMRSLLVVISLSVVAGLSQSARGDTVTATLTGLTPYTFPTSYLQGAGDITGGTGAIGWQGVGSNPSDFTGSFTTFCIDLIQDINFGGTYNYTEMPVASAPQPGAYPSGSPVTGMGSVKASELNTLFAEQFNNLTTDNALEAFQLAIWNVVYDTDASVNTGDGAFYVVSGFDPSVISMANGYLTGATDLSHQEVFGGTLIALVGENGAQDQIYAQNSTQNQSASSVPAPQTWLGGGILLGACLLVGRKRNSTDLI